MKITKPLKAIAEKSGRLKAMKGAEISRRISKTAPFDEQMAVTMNALEALFTHIEADLGIDIRPEDYKVYQTLRKSVKEDIGREVDEV